jgi:hypothetical protein
MVELVAASGTSRTQSRKTFPEDIVAGWPFCESKCNNFVMVWCKRAAPLHFFWQKHLLLLVFDHQQSSRRGENRDLFHDFLGIFRSG